MFRQRILVIAATMLLHLGVVGTALSQTGPLPIPGAPTPNTNVRHLNPDELLKLLAARDSDVRYNCQGGRFEYVFREKVRGVAQRVLVIWTPSKNEVLIQVTVSELFSAERAAIVNRQLEDWNPRVAPYHFFVDDDDDNNYVLAIQSVLTNSPPAQDVVAELNHVLECVDKAQPLWVNLRKPG